MGIIHPEFVPQPFNGEVSVRWLVTDQGECPGKDYYDSTPACRVALLALARQLAQKGRVGKVPENGHPLQAPYRGLHELKPGNHRFMYFRVRDACYITNGAPKRSAAKQRKDYAQAKRLMDDFKSRERDVG